MEVIQNEYQVYSRNSEHLQHMCEKAGFFPGLLQLYLLHGQIRQAVDLVICTDDEPGLFHVLSDVSTSLSSPLFYLFNAKKPYLTRPD
jgi:hypothetical protein